MYLNLGEAELLRSGKAELIRSGILGLMFSYEISVGTLSDVMPFPPGQLLGSAPSREGAGWYIRFYDFDIIRSRAVDGGDTTRRVSGGELFGLAAADLPREGRAKVDSNYQTIRIVRRASSRTRRLCECRAIAAITCMRRSGCMDRPIGQPSGGRLRLRLSHQVSGSRAGV